MAQFFFEITQEEIPARMQIAAEKQLKELLAKILEDLTIDYQSIQTMITPLRLIGCIEGIAEKSQESIARIRGPKETADPSIIEKFKNSHTSQPVTFTGFDGYIYAEKVTAPTPTLQLIPKLMEQILTRLSWAKSMRWPGSTLEWVRPIRRIYCQFDQHPLIFDMPLLGGVILDKVQSTADRGPIQQNITGPSHSNSKDRTLNTKNGSSIAGFALVEDDQFTTSNHVLGHRFMSPEELRPADFENYLELLGQNNVMPDHKKRMEYIHEQLLGQGDYLIDQDLLEENAGLAEWPIVYIGAIDQQFMTLPQEVLSTTMKIHQRYFTYPGKPVFGVIANALPEDGSAMVAGYERVLRARLSDAQFFYEQDCSKKLEDFAQKLTTIVFHKNSGTLAEKASRLEAFMETAEGKTAAHFCKADLATSMVYEFPELQGTMGRIYGEKQGLSPEICTALQQHYWPLSAEHPLPTTLLAAQLSFADKLDTLLSLLGSGVKVSGSKDPLGLRRLAIGVIRLIQEFDFDFDATCKKLCVILGKGAARDRGSIQQNISGSSHSNSKDRNLDTKNGSSITGCALAEDDRIAIVSTFIKDRAETYFNDPLMRGLMHIPITTMIKRLPIIQSFVASESGAEFLAQYKRLCGLLNAAPQGVILGKPTLQHPFEITLNDWNIKHVELTDIQALEEQIIPMRDYFDQVKVLEGTPETVNGRLTLLSIFKDKVQKFYNFY